MSKQSLITKAAPDTIASIKAKEVKECGVLAKLSGYTEGNANGHQNKDLSFDSVLIKFVEGKYKMGFKSVKSGVIGKVVKVNSIAAVRNVLLCHSTPA